MPKKHTKIDKAMFAQVKSLQDYNIKLAVMTQITGLSPASVSRIRAAKDWNDFIEMRKKHSAKANAKHNALRDEEAVEAIDTIAQGLNALSEAANSPSPDDMRELFPDGDIELSLHQREVIALERSADADERQAAAMERMADAWEAAPAARKSIFRG